MIKKQKVIIISIGAFFAGLLVCAGILALLIGGIGNYTLTDKATYNSMSSFYEEYKDLAAVDEAIDTYFYEDTSDIKKSDSACKGVVNALDDPYSAYMTKSEFENFEASTTGEFSGVGIVFSKDEEDRYVVLSVYEDTPADKAGVKAGDFILKVDGKSYENQDVMAAKIRGEKGSKVTIDFERDGKKSKVTLIRDEIVVKTVTTKVLDGDTGYICIGEFLSQTSDDFDKALESLEKKGCTKLILDLRNNGGGLVSEAVDIADVFIDKGYITCTVDNKGEKYEYKADKDKKDIPMVVLVNEGSASSSEILGGALQDNGYKLVGAKTFGKGIIQSTMELNDGSAIKLTVSRYLTPAGHEVHKKGLTPDYKVKASAKGDPQLDKARELLK